MNILTSRLGLAAAWVVTVVLLYKLVPSTMSMANFLFAAAVLLLLGVVVFAKGRGARRPTSMTDVLYEVDHPVVARKP